MPNQRSADQTLITLAVDVKLLAAIERARAVTREDRSQFIRVAIWEALGKHGEYLPESIVRAPDRVRYPPPRPAVELNDKPSSKVDRAAKSLAKSAAAKVRAASPKPAPKREAHAPTARTSRPAPDADKE